MTKGIKECSIPMEPLNCESGYFIMVDITQAIPLIPEAFLLSHDFEDPSNLPLVPKNQIFMEDGRVPYDLAFCRWIAVTKGVIMMPNCIFYNKTSPYKTYNFVRVAICKGLSFSEQVLERLRS